MIENLPSYVNLLFVVTTMLTLWFLYKASGKSKGTLYVSIVWLIVQGIIACKGFYTVTNTMPPHFVFLVGPAFLLIIFVFLFKRGRNYLDTLDPKWLTYLHVVRVPVELTLLFLFIHKQVPQLMTFEGRNFDIISGLSAPLIAYFGYTKLKLNKGILIAWNVVCLVLLFNIVISAVLSVPTNFQKLGFEQPNVGVLYFPFIWLPCFIVPVVLLSHLATIRSLLKKK